MTPQFDRLSALGYDVEQASSAYEESPGVVVPATYRVRGYGADLLIAGDDSAALASLLDPDLHAERVERFEAPADLDSVVDPAEATAARVASALESLPDGPLHKEDLGGVIAALLGA